MLGKKKKSETTQAYNPKTGLWAKIVGGKFTKNSTSPHKGVKKCK